MRLTDSPEFERVYRQGTAYRGKLFSVHAFPNELGTPRLGLSVSRKVGNAVTRNAVRRGSGRCSTRASPRCRIISTSWCRRGPRPRRLRSRSCGRSSARSLGKFAGPVRAPAGLTVRLDRCEGRARDLIQIYRRYLSPMLPPSCRFTPSCSLYTVQAIEKYGVSRGIFMGVLRVLRCHPFARGGFDPVR